jgi:hypothetical protein
MNQVVIHTKTGQLIKGTTNDFLPTKDRFHLVPPHAPANSKPTEILISDLKAVFFVKDLEGFSGHVKRNTFDPEHPLPGRKIRVVFQDGEIMMGTTQGYQPGRPGFFVVPVDPGSNNERCFVVSAATREITLL